MASKRIFCITKPRTQSSGDSITLLGAQTLQIHSGYILALCVGSFMGRWENYGFPQLDDATLHAASISVATLSGIFGGQIHSSLCGPPCEPYLRGCSENGFYEYDTH